MKTSFPLSLKFSLWLLLNLLLLGAIAIGLLATQGGFGWDSLVRGPSGKRAQQMGNVIVGEYMAAAPSEVAQRGVLERFGTSYHVQLRLIHPHLPGASRSGEGLPKAVTARIEVGPGMRTDGRGREGDPPQAGAVGDFRPDDGGGGPPRGPPTEADQARGRFLVRAGEPASFWLGVRVPIDRPLPVTLLARVDSWWTLMRLLDLQAWLVAGAAIVVFSVLFWLPFVRGITHALGQLTAATGRIAEGRFETRVPEKRRDEIGALGSSVNRMAGRLDTLVNGQKRFLADVAHELGSPIARLQIAVEILETRAAPALRDPVADVREEVQQMGALVEELLAFTKAGLRPRTAELASVDLASLVQEVMKREDSAGRITYAVPHQLAARADAPLLARAIGNLARNALRYCGDAAPIAIAAVRHADTVTITIEDEGPGVPTDALPRLGEPFYRPESARTRETGGVGLGLAIVRSSVAACGGDVRFANRTPHGFRAEITLAVG